MTNPTMTKAPALGGATEAFKPNQSKEKKETIMNNNTSETLTCPRYLGAIEVHDDVTAWRDNILKHYNAIKEELLDNPAFLEWEKKQLKQYNIWTRDDCLAKWILSDPSNEWPLPKEKPYWAEKVELITSGYSEFWLKFETKIERDGVAIEISEDAFLDVVTGEFTTPSMEFGIFNTSGIDAGLTLVQFAELRDLADEALTLLNTGEKNILVRNTEPGEPELNGIGGGL